MKRLIPTELPELLVNWLSVCFACVKWNDSLVGLTHFKYSLVLDKARYCSHRICL